ncbi:thymidylate kinase [Actinoplanes sp. NPDC026670]|uniref:thymidylate kinase n=1 Tax=Actinoplanes sp. NPDC026670 TaxID=3154700 RepID=UPI0033D4A07B
MGRAEVLDTVAAALDDIGEDWAWQGAAGAPDRWVTDHGPADLDVWHAAASRSDPVAALAKAHPCAVVADASDPRRLRHTSVAVLTGDGLGVVDFTHGDLRVGPVLLVPAAEVTVDRASHRLTGAAAVADLLVRPVLRGRIPGEERLAEAVEAWAAAEPAQRSALARRLTTQLGAAVASDLIAIADGARPDPGLPRRARLRLAARSLTPGTIGATWAQRRSVLPAGPAAGPLGLRTRGVVVALVGTDGSGKSTVAAMLGDRLRGRGFATSAAYFGMARGNLPGVALARRLLGVGSTAPDTRAADPRPGGLDHSQLRRVAAWYYAGEYGWRYLRDVLPALVRGRVVIADRWVYDLRESPWPGSPAARVAELLVPAPDLLVLPDAPIDVIHRRKPERSRAEQREQQERFHDLLAEQPARHAEMLIDTSSPASADDVMTLVAAVIEAAHAPRRRR